VSGKIINKYNDDLAARRKVIKMLIYTTLAVVSKKKLSLAFKATAQLIAEIHFVLTIYSAFKMKW